MKYKILDPYAYESSRLWFTNTEHDDPGLAQKMQDYSDKQGWNREQHIHAWIPVLINWYHKNKEK